MIGKKVFSFYNIFLLAIAFTGISLVWYSTQLWGAGLISDTYQYVSVGRSLVSGNGFSIPYGDSELLPMTKYPPMLSIVIAMLEIAKINAYDGALYANIFFFSVSIILVALSAKRLTNSKFYSLLAALLIAVSPVVVEVHSWILSEPLYILISLSVFFVLEFYVRNRTKYLLIFAAFLAAALFLTRYVGLSLILAVALVLLFVQKSTWKQKIVDVLVFGVISTTPTVFWTLRGMSMTGSFNDRTVQFHPPSKNNYFAAIENILSWFLPEQLVAGREKIIIIAGIVVLFIGFLYLAILSKRQLLKREPGNFEILSLHFVYILTYGAMVVVSKTWFDDNIGFSDRMLSPMYISLVILLVFGFAKLSSNFGTIASYICIILGILLVAYNIGSTIPLIQQLHDKGAGVFRSGWHTSEVIRDLRNYSEYSVYTNSNSTLYLWSDRTGYSLNEFRSAQETGVNDRALLVIFKHVPPKGEKLEKLVSGLEFIEEDKFAAIYLFGPSQ